MTFPPKSVMQDLAALALGNEFVCDPDTGRMVVLLDRNRAVEIGEEIDELFRRGWAEEKDDEIRVTERGRYWLKRWLGVVKYRLNV